MKGRQQCRRIIIIMNAEFFDALDMLEQTRGINKALKRMCEIILENVKEPQNKVLAISHCNCPERAEYVKGLLLDKCRFMDVVIVDTAGVATMYANDGGIVVAV